MDITLAGGVVTYEPDDDQLGRVSLELAAMDGEVGGGVLPVPDPTAAIGIHTGRQVRVDEAGVCVSNGFLLDRTYVKGPQPQAPAYEYNFAVMDANALLHGFRMEHVRPAETAYARVLACIGDLPGGTLTTWVLSPGDYTMPAKTYATDNGWDDLITDIVEFTGKTTFLHDTSAGVRCLHMHVLTTGHTSGLSISDVASAVNGTTVFAPQSPEAIFTSVDTANDVKGRDQAGRTSTATDSASITAHDADGLKHQVLRDFEAGSQADLDQKVAVFLANQKDDQINYSCTIGPLDFSALSKIRVGDLIPITSSVMGLTAASKRISHMTLAPYGSPPAPGLWNASLEMGAPKRRRSRGKPVVTGVVIDPGVTGGGADAACCTPWACEENTFKVTTAGGAEVLACVFPSHASNQSCTSAPGTANSDAMYVYNGATYRVDYLVYHAPGALGSNGLNASLARVGGGGLGAPPTPARTVGDGVPPLVYMGDARGPAGCTFDPVDDIPTASTTWTADFDGYVVAQLGELACGSGDSYASSISAHITYLSGPDPRFEGVTGACANGLPGQGQPVVDPAETTTGDGVATTDTTAHAALFGYAAGSLVIAVNGLQPWPGVHEVDPDAGTLAYDYPPPLGSDVQRLYDRGTVV